MKKSKKMFIFMILFTLLIVINPTFSNAVPPSNPNPTIWDGGGSGGDTSFSPFNNPGVYNPNIGAGVSTHGMENIVEKANKIVGVITIVGIITSVVTMAILGMKYIMGSVAEKAEYKSSMIPYIIGTVLLFSISTIVGIISKLIQGTSLLNK